MDFSEINPFMVLHGGEGRVEGWGDRRTFSLYGGKATIQYTPIGKRFGGFRVLTFRREFF